MELIAPSGEAGWSINVAHFSLSDRNFTILNIFVLTSDRISIVSLDSTKSSTGICFDSII